MDPRLGRRVQALLVGLFLFDCVLVKMAEGKETDYTVRPVTIEGEFYMRKYAGPDGNVWAIFRLKDGQVK